MAPRSSQCHTHNCERDEELGHHLLETFEAHALTWEWRVTPVDAGFVKLRGDDGFTDESSGLHQDPEGLARHPLLRWFAATQDPTAQSSDRVPQAISSRRDRDWLKELLAPFSMEQQVSIPCWMAGPAYGAFVLGRPGDDFDDAEMELARRVQPLLTGLARQVHAQSGLGWSGPPAGVAAVGLSCSETAVLSLLARGYTALRMARILGVSPRTVHKHLEHAYRKLGVSDRLMAVQVAVELGLVHPGPDTSPHRARLPATAGPQA